MTGQRSRSKRSKKWYELTPGEKQDQECADAIRRGEDVTLDFVTGMVTVGSDLPQFMLKSTRRPSRLRAVDGLTDAPTLLEGDEA